jgi:hypothetical protein
VKPNLNPGWLKEAAVSFILFYNIILSLACVIIVLDTEMKFFACDLEALPGAWNPSRMHKKKIFCMFLETNSNFPCQNYTMFSSQKSGC